MSTIQDSAGAILLALAALVLGLLAASRRRAGRGAQTSSVIGAATSSPTSPFDRAEALALCADDPAVLQAILARIPDEARSQQAAIREALDRADDAAVRLAAHRLKGSLLVIAAGPGAERAAAVERAAANHELAALPRLVAALDQDLARLIAAIAGAGEVRR